MLQEHNHLSMKQTIPTLRRRLGLTLLVLYGTGVTIGAGIYVLVGAVSAYAGTHAPWAFLLAAAVMGLTVASYAELCTRFPVAAGEAAYVRAAFRSRMLSTLTGATMIATAVIASATVAIGASGYIAQFVAIPQEITVTVVIVALGLVSAAGVLESVILAGLFTVIEVGGLLIILVAALYQGLPFGAALAPPPFDLAVWSGLGFASLLAFFAFIGFEDLTNMVEETRAPERTVPRAMAITLILTAMLYAIVAAVAVTAVTPARLAASPAPLSLVFRELAGVSPATISAIAIVSTLNTVLAEMTMASRVVYGLSNLEDLPRWLGRVHRRTATPLFAIGSIVAITVALALLFPFEKLAESTSVATLAVFAMVNLSLLRLRWEGHHTAGPHLRIPIWVPAAGFVTCLALMAAAFD
jgi:amino acid transporter